jgi:hypothetical protein
VSTPDVRHGEGDARDYLAALAQLDTDDPDLALVYADMHLWNLAHPCECEALCTCDTSPV